MVDTTTATTSSTTQSNALYLRKWQIIIFKPAYKTDAGGNKVRDKDHDTAVDVSNLKCVFKTKQKVETAVTLCTLAVYNMNAATEGGIIKEGFQIAIDGGYQNGQYGNIFTGDVVQVIRNRENGINYRLELIALKGTLLFDTNYVRSTIAAGSKPRDVIATVAKQADTPIEVSSITSTLPETPLPRGKVLFGTPGKYFRDISVFHNASYNVDDSNKLVFKKAVDEIPAGQVLILSPTTGLVGTPVYSDDGIHIKALLDSRIKILSLIKIDNEIIQKALLNIDATGKGSNLLPQATQFDKDGEYQVFSVVHSGDTWGDEWVTEVVGVGRSGRAGLFVSIQSANQTIR